MMKKRLLQHTGLILILTLFGLKVNFAQESLSPLLINGALYKTNEASKSFLTNGCSNLILRYDTLELEDFEGGFMDDFTTNSILGNHFPSAIVKDTLLYGILDNGIPFGDTSFVADTTYHIKINISPTDTTTDSVPFLPKLITFNKLDSCPIISKQVEVWPAYNIIDTVVKANPDTIFSDKPNYVQNTLKTYIVWADSATRWAHGSVYINPTMGINPPTIQVATFDGLDNKGYPYDFNENSYGLADSLVSLPINLNKPASDSLYLSFYYQGGGLGNEPESLDSLTLHFYSPEDQKWHAVWNAKGRKMTAFEQVLIPIKDELYLKKGFRFRFRNYGSLSGSLDHWHLDYVKLAKTRYIGDTIHNDLAFSQPLNTLLKSYTAVPWIHYRSNPSAYMLKDTTLTYHSNLDTLRPTLTLKVLLNRQNTTLKTVPINPHPQSEPRTHFTIPINELWEPANNFEYPTNLDDTCAFFDVVVAANRNGASTTVNKHNDTIRLRQVFQNYYAYDDGTPEAGYHLNTNGGGGMLAYKFSMGTVKDSLAGIFMYFNPVAIDASFEKYWLTIWDANGPNGQPGNIIFQNKNLSQPLYNRIGRFQYDEFEELVELTGDFYVGFKQLTEKHINIGFDKNINSGTKIYFNTSGDWYQSSFEGSLMLRPAFKFHKKVEISVPESQITTAGIKAFPVPTSGFLNINGIEKLENPFIVVRDISGKIVWSENGKPNRIDLSKLENGLYLMQITDKGLNFNAIQKIIVSKGG